MKRLFAAASILALLASAPVSAQTIYPAPGSGSGSGTVTSVATGTGLTGGPITTSGTLTIDSTVTTLTGTQTLTNKTLTSPVLTTPNLGTPSAINLTNASGIVPGTNFLAGTLVSANFNATAGSDQPITLTGSTKWAITGFLVTNCSTSLTLAKAGFYAGTGATNLITTGQGSGVGFTGLTTSTSVYQVEPVSNSFATATVPFNFAYFTTASQTVQFHMGTAQGAAATCDIYVFAKDLT